MNKGDKALFFDWLIENNIHVNKLSDGKYRLWIRDLDEPKDWHFLADGNLKSSFTNAIKSLEKFNKSKSRKLNSNKVKSIKK